MGPERFQQSSSFINFKYLDNHLQDEIIVNLATEFYAHRSIEEGIETFRNSIENGRETVNCLFINEQLIGAVTQKVYPYSSIENQLYVEGRYREGSLEELRLRKFRELLLDNGFMGDYEECFELAYTLVYSDYRGNGYGRDMFRYVVEDFNKSISKKMLFVIPRGRYVQKGIGPKLTSYMLDVERKINGSDEYGRVNVTGVWNKACDVSLNVGETLDTINELSGTDQIVHMARSYGFRSIGFVKNMSPVWCLESR